MPTHSPEAPSKLCPLTSPPGHSGTQAKKGGGGSNSKVTTALASPLYLSQPIALTSPLHLTQPATLASPPPWPAHCISHPAHCPGQATASHPGHALGRQYPAV